MNRAVSFALASACALVLLPACKGRICDEWKPLKLPKVTSVDKCHDTRISGTTTASTEEFVSAFEAYRIRSRASHGRMVDTQSRWLRFQKKGDSSNYRMQAKFSAARNGTADFAIDKSTDSGNERWIPEATWKRIATLDAERTALATKLGAAARIFAETKTAPAQCDGTPPQRAPSAVPGAEPFFLRTDSYGIAGWPEESRAYTTAPAPTTPPTTQKPQSRDISIAVWDLSKIDALSALRTILVIRVTDYAAPRFHDRKAGEARPILSLFYEGRASFEVGIVDLVEGRVLCKTKGEATSSQKVDVERTASGSVSGDPGGDDLRKNIDRAAIVALARPSSASKRP